MVSAVGLGLLPLSSLALSSLAFSSLAGSRVERDLIGPAGRPTGGAGSWQLGSEGGVLLHGETHGSGHPVTVFAAGLGSTIAETRLLAVGVPGSRAFFAFRGHRPTYTPAGARCGYPELTADLEAVARAQRAQRAVGASLGAAALLRLLASDPDRFERVALFLPAALDRPREDRGAALLRRLADTVEAGDRAGVAAVLAAQLPELAARPAGAAYLAERAAGLAGSALAPLIRAVLATVPVPDPTVLARVRCPVLVIAQEEDPVHPVGVARAVAAALPSAHLEVFSRGAALWRDRDRLRTLMSQFLGQ